MYIKSFGINIDKSKRLWGIILVALLVAVTLIGISFFLVFRKSNSKNINKLSDLFNAKSYYAEYSLNVISNKNENTYKMKEWYVCDEEEYKFRIETVNKENNFVFLGNQNSIYIKSDEQLSSMNLSYDSKKNNIFSVSSVMEFLAELSLSAKNSSYISNNCYKIEEVEQDGLLKFIVIFNEVNCVVNGSINCTCENCNCKLCSKFTENGMKVGRLEIVLDKESLMPKQYVIYDKKGQIYANILYDKFLINNDFDEKLFAN